MTTTTKGPASAGARSTSKAAGLCVGASLYDDAGLSPLPDAAVSAREIAAALDTKIVRGVSALIDPPGSDDLFLALQKSIHDAKGGSFFLYFAGHALWRDGELRLAARSTELEGAKACVPWSDVDDLLVRERIESAMIVLNIDHSGDKPGIPRVTHGATVFMGSVRAHALKGANLRLRAYADAVLGGLRKRPLDLESFLRDGQLDAGAIGRYLTEKAPRAVEHRVFSEPSGPRFILRELAEDLARSKARGSQPMVEVPVDFTPPPLAPAETPPSAAPSEPPPAAKPAAAPVKQEPKTAPVKAEPKTTPVKAEPTTTPIKTAPKAAPAQSSPVESSPPEPPAPPEVHDRELAERKPADITPAAPGRPMMPYLIAALVALALIYWFYLR